jgi:thymidylate kinase
MFAALEGIDGVGKSTIHDMISQSPRVRSLGFRFASKKLINSTHPYARLTSSTLAKLVWPDDGGLDHPVLGDEYWLHINAAWFGLYSRILRQEAIPRLLVDHWSHRFRAKMLVKGFSPDIVNAAFSGCLEPDVVILLDGDPLSMTSRRAFKPQERGYMEDAAALTADAYAAYQERIRSHLREMASERGWTVVDQCHARKPADIVAEVEQAIAQAAGEPG